MNPEAFLKEFGHLAETEGGISALREISTTLALEGRLSVADPKDGSAADLLGAIWGELEAMLTARQSAVLRPEPAASDAMCSIPEHWEWERLGRLGEVVGGVTKGRKLGGRETKDFPYLRVANVQRGFLQLDEVKNIEIPLDELEKYVLKEGDVLLTEGGDWDKLGRACIWNTELPVCLHQNHVFRVRPVGKDGWAMLPRWLELYCNAPPGKMYFQKAAKRTTNLASINMNQLRNCPVPVPPLPEQKRIVEKVDQLMALCDELEAKQKEKREKSVSFNKAALSAVVHAPDKSKLKSSWSRVQDHFEVLYELPENVKELRQTILQLAVMGKLVRQEGGDDGEPPIDSVGTRQGPFALLNGWKWVSLAEIGRTQTGTTPSTKESKYWGQGVPFVTPGDLENFTIRTPNKCLTPDGLAVGREVAPGSILMVCIGGSLGKLAKTEIAVSCNQQINALTPVPQVDCDYVMFALASGYFQAEAWRRAGQGTLPIISKGKWERIPVPLPPSSLQPRISAKIRFIMNMCDDLEVKLAQHRDQGQRLMQAVVEGLVA